MSSTNAWMGQSSARGALALFLLLGSACAKGGDTSTVRQSASVAGASATPAQPNLGSPGLGAAVPTLGQPCTVEGVRDCDGSKLAVVCSGAAWQMAAVCNGNEICSSRAGEQRGTCRPIIAECDAHAAFETFCMGTMVRSCLDRVSFVDEACSEHAVCRADNGGARCQCATGFQSVNGTCEDIDECALGSSGCDAEAECKNLPGSVTCGGCSMGYLGGKDGVCRPALIDLAVVPGALSPAFSPTQSEYAVSVPITTASIEVTATFPEEATLEIDGSAGESGKAWRSRALPLGDTELELVVSRPEFPSTSYKLVITRGQGQDGYLKPDNGGAADRFGGSLALSADVLVVGAPGEDAGAIGSTDTPASPVIASGAAYVFVREGNQWVQRAYLKPDVPSLAGGFGSVVAISGDTIVVGAPGATLSAAGSEGQPATARPGYAAGAAYVFVRDGDQWKQQATLRASNASAGDAFGNVLAIEGDTVLVGAPLEGSNATGINGEGTNDTALGSGAAYVFVREEGLWTQQAFLKAASARAGDGFGFAVALDHDTAVVAALRSSADTGVAPPATVGSEEGLPSSDEAAAPSLPAATPAAASAATGTAYVFSRDGRNWALDTELSSEAAGAGARFGYSISISGNTIVVGAPGEVTRPKSNPEAQPGDPVASGAAHVFVRGREGWSEQAQLVPTRDPALAPGTAGDNFGASVKVVDHTVLIGAFAEDSNAAGLNGDQSNGSLPSSGAAYLFTRAGSRWSEPVYVKASNTRANDEFGRHTALARNGFAVGASNEDSGARGVGGNQADTSAPNSGAVYSFR